MKKYMEFTVSVTPTHAMAYLLSDTDLKKEVAFKDMKRIGDKEIIILVFERFFFRNNSSASLTVVLENTQGKTTVKCLSTGSGAGLLNIGWGAGTSFIQSVSKTLQPHIVQVISKN